MADYFDDREISYEDGFCVIKPKEYQEPQPIWCPICELAMKKQEDAFSWQEYRCCNCCENSFVIPNKEKWLNGWRPEQGDIENHRQILLQPKKVIIK